MEEGSLIHIVPKVSIILPSFNRKNHIAATIESCLSQTYLNFELIIIDDFSTDGVQEIIAHYVDLDTRIKFIQNKFNKKLPATLNVGFSCAQGEYLTWISDDNLFHPTAIEEMVSVLDKKHEIGLVYADYTTINQLGEVKHRLYQEEPEYLPIRDCVGACFMYRSVLRDILGGYNENLFLVEDYEYWLRIALVSKLYHINKSLYYYRTHPNSLTKKRKHEISEAQILLKSQFQGKFNLSDDLKPINDLYLCFIAKKNFKIYLKFLLIILINPVITLTYIFKHIKRMYYVLDNRIPSI